LDHQLNADVPLLQLQLLLNEHGGDGEDDTPLTIPLRYTLQWEDKIELVFLI
jgi:hypothetical protein